MSTLLSLMSFSPATHNFQVIEDVVHIYIWRGRAWRFIENGEIHEKMVTVTITVSVTIFPRDLGLAKGKAIGLFPRRNSEAVNPTRLR